MMPSATIIGLKTQSDYPIEKLKKVEAEQDELPALTAECLSLAKKLAARYRVPLALALRLFLPAEMRKTGLFPCGRLDKNTLGLILLTDNGELGHRLLAPKSHVEKRYYFRSKFPIRKEEAARFASGLILEDGYETKPAKIDLEGDGDCGVITLVEGKYHQIKRMLEALQNKIVYLERISFGPLTLDPSLSRGEWRYLSEEEIRGLEAHGIGGSAEVKEEK